MTFRRVAVVALLLVAMLAPAPAAADTPPAVWVFGDSIAAGTWLPDPATQSWPARLDERMGPGQQVLNLGQGGMAVAYDVPGQWRMDYTVRYWLNSTPAAELPPVIVFAGGVNDLIRGDDGMSATRWAVYELSAWIAANYPQVRFLVATLTPMRADHKHSPVALSQRRQVYNEWARAMYGPTGQLVDVGDLLTAGATYADVRFMADSLHPDADGAAIYAHGVGDVLAEKGYL